MTYSTDSNSNSNNEMGLSPSLELRAREALAVCEARLVDSVTELAMLQLVYSNAKDSAEVAEDLSVLLEKLAPYKAPVRVVTKDWLFEIRKEMVAHPSHSDLFSRVRTLMVDMAKQARLEHLNRSLES